MNNYEATFQIPGARCLMQISLTARQEEFTVSCLICLINKANPYFPREMEKIYFHQFTLSAGTVLDMSS